MHHDFDDIRGEPDCRPELHYAGTRTLVGWQNGGDGGGQTRNTDP
jgi:hypothetical protein